MNATASCGAEYQRPLTHNPLHICLSPDIKRFSHERRGVSRPREDGALVDRKHALMQNERGADAGPSSPSSDIFDLRHLMLRTNGGRNDCLHLTCNERIT